MVIFPLDYHEAPQGGEGTPRHHCSFTSEEMSSGRPTGLWEQPRPVACFSSVPFFSHWITGPLTPSGSRGEGPPPIVDG